ncbi:hypothetical protein [uncultured Formosa sp.]|uniref:hypothetical protein n=1 Tax=uncultured Formosa sp. TaxID=255435 RepID=UPI002609F6A8|nr:hypothetical protein [uncultured Formosa sp.]
MKYLSPEIEAWSKNENAKSLVRPGVSCGIFQDCNSNEEASVSPYLKKLEDKSK